MMKQQQSTTKRQPGNICKLLLILVGFKLCLLGVILIDPSFDFINFNSEDKSVIASFNTTDFDERAQNQHLASLPINSSNLEAYKSNVDYSSSNTSTAEVTSKPALLNLSDGLTQATTLLHSQPLPVIRRGVAYAATPAQIPNQDNQLALDALRRKQDELDRKEQDLKALQTELDSRLQQMQEVEVRLNAMLKEANEVKSAKYRQLIDVLSNMKAKQAALVLETLDEKIAVKALAGMRGRQAGEILSLANPDKAARLAEQLAKMQMPLE